MSRDIPNQKNTTFLTMRVGIVNFPQWEENVYRNRVAISQPLTGRNKREGGRCVDSDCAVWIETAKDVERICKVK
jgi:hypothetical protein